MSDAGAVLYAKDMRRLAAFYSVVAGLAEVQQERDFTVLENEASQLTIVAIPDRIAATIEIAAPPRRRSGTPVKVFFVVPNLAESRKTAAELGGELESADREWKFGEWRVCDGHDPEGNVFQLREPPVARNTRAASLLSVAPVLLVAEPGRSLAYYRDRLGFAIEFVYEDAYAAVVRDGCRIHLKCAPPMKRDQAAFEAAGHLDACFAVRDAHALASEFTAGGAEFSVRPRDMPYGSEFYIRDPDGYVLGFVESVRA